ncbi:MAG: CRAL-TRIO domain-containing protein [Monoraphidium minutum]|nr:MAG: CRAL-TRIO domain-containing protein [Monoraphidium minutum]
MTPPHGAGGSGVWNSLSMPRRSMSPTGAGPKSPTASKSWSSTFSASRRSHSLAIHAAEAAGASHGEAVLAEFKRMIADAGLQLPPELIVNGDADATLRRFLRARKQRLDAALAMLEKCLAWRKRVGADGALRNPLPPAMVALIRECRPSSYIGFHRDGFPIFVERLGMLDGERIEREKLTEDQILSYHQREMEFMAQVVFVEASRRMGHTIDRVVTIMDAAGLTFSMLTGFAQRLFRALTAMDSDNYPETCQSIFIVNSTAAFGAIWRVVRVFVDQGTRDKVKVLGSGNPMLAALLQEFDAAQVPSFLGGALDYDARRRQWMDAMDTAMAEAQRAAKDGAGALPAGAAGGTAGLNGFERLPPLRTSAAASQQSDADEDGFMTPASAASRVSSAVSVYFDAIDMASLGSRGPSSSGGGAPAGSSASGGSLGGDSPGASPRAGPRGGGGPGAFDVALPHYQPHSAHHVHRASKLAAVPSGELPGGEGPQPRCCVIS